MATYLDDQDLMDAAKALGEYIEEVGYAARTMANDARDCHDNLGNDTVTAGAVEAISECAQKLQRTINEAEDLRERITQKAHEIQELDGYFS